MKGCAVDVIFLSEFDINTGSVVRCVYPTFDEEFFKDVSLDEIADWMLPEGAQKYEKDSTLFILNRKKTDVRIDIDVDDWEIIGSDDEMKKMSGLNGDDYCEENVLFCFNVVSTLRDSLLERGSIVRSIAVGVKHQYFTIYKNLIENALMEYNQAPSTSILERLYVTLNSLDLSSLLEHRKKQIVYYSSHIGEPMYYYNKIEDSPVVLPLNYLPDETYDSSLLLLLRTFGSSIMTIYDAILLEKRVMFLGFDMPASVVCKYVVSACLLVYPIEGVLKERCYPYCNFGGFSFLNSKGYIVGVSNPFIKEKGSVYWDILCDINQGEVIQNTQNVSFFNRIKTTNNKENQEFLSKVLPKIERHEGGETWLRKQFKNYTLTILEDCLLSSKLSDRSTKFKETESFLVWKNSDLGNYYISWELPGGIYRKSRSIVARGKDKDYEIKMVELICLLEGCLNDVELLIECYGIIKWTGLDLLSDINGLNFDTFALDSYIIYKIRSTILEHTSQYS